MPGINNTSRNDWSVSDHIRSLESYDKHIWEGWTVQHFIDELTVTIGYQSFENREQLKKWCMSEQPYYKKYIPEVVDYFAATLDIG